MEQLERIAQLGEPLQKQAESMARLYDSFSVSDKTSAKIAQVVETMRSETPPVQLLDPAVSPIRSPTPAKKQESSGAGRVIQMIASAYEAEKTEKQDLRHTVYVLVYLPSGDRIIVDRMTEDSGGQFVRIEGWNASTQQTETANVGALGFQYDFFVVEHRPTLYIVDNDRHHPDSDHPA